MSNLETVTIRLRKGQREKLQALLPRIPYNQTIRKLVDSFIHEAETEIKKRKGDD